MTEAERLRAQADRCMHLAKQTKDQAIAGVLVGLAAKSHEQASALERAAIEKRHPLRIERRGELMLGAAIEGGE